MPCRELAPLRVSGSGAMNEEECAAKEFFVFRRPGGSSGDPSQVALAASPKLCPPGNPGMDTYPVKEPTRAEPRAKFEDVSG